MKKFTLILFLGILFIISPCPALASNEFGALKSLSSLVPKDYHIDSKAVGIVVWISGAWGSVKNLFKENLTSSDQAGEVYSNSEAINRVNAPFPPETPGLKDQLEGFLTGETGYYNKDLPEDCATVQSSEKCFEDASFPTKEFGNPITGQ